MRHYEIKLEPPICSSKCPVRLTPRFKPYGNDIPGPGTYFRKSYKAPNGRGPHSTRPTFERGGPCRSTQQSRDWSLAPNRYKIIDWDSIEMKPKKIVSLRGPYDLFTPEKRDESSIKNHLYRERITAATWPIALPDYFQESKKHPSGRLYNKTGRDKPYRGRESLVDIVMAPKKPSDPGPAHYTVVKPKEFKQNIHGFNSSYDKGPNYQKVIVWPSVGRYNIKKLTCGIPGHGHKHVFLSRIPRTIGAYLPEPLNSF